MAVEINKDDSGLTIARSGTPPSVLLIHGYGGSKEEMLPLGYGLSLEGIGSYLIDLPGHGGAEGLFDIGSAKSSIAGRLVAMPSIKAIVGHSLGAVMALFFDLPAICISPPLNFAFEGRRSELIKVLRPRRVREASTFSGLESVIAAAKKAARRNALLVLYGSGDLKTVKEYAALSRRQGIPTVRVASASHLDTISAPKICEIILPFIKRAVYE